MNKAIVLYTVLERFRHDELYEATDLAKWLGIPEKHRLMRYYLNRLTREGWLLKVYWRQRTFYAIRQLEYLFESCDLFKRRMAGVYVVRRR